MAGTKASVPLARSGSEVMAGPGQNPERPQPTPNKPNKPGIDILSGWQEKPRRQHGFWPAEDKPVADEGHQDRARHHENKAGIQGAERIEKILDLRRVRHSRNQKAQAKHETSKEIDEITHGQPPSR